MQQNNQNHIILKNTAILSSRCLIMAWQLSAKRAILGRKDEMLLAAYSDIAAFEGLILILLLGGFHIISRDISLQPILTEENAKEVGAIYRL